MAARFALVALLIALSADASADTLYRLSLDGRPSLDAALAAGAVVRHIGTAEALVAGDAWLGDELRRAGRACEEVARLDDGPLLYLCYAAGGRTDLGRYGAVLWSEPDGATLVSVSPGAVEGLRAACFMAYPLPDAVAADRWFDNEPPPHVRTAAARDPRAARGLVEGVMASISADSLVAHVERLSEHPGGAPRTRYVRRSECLSEAEPYLLGQLGAVLPVGAPVDTQRFDILGFTCEQGTAGPIVEYPARNVIGVLEGNGDLGGCYVVSAHYDDTAPRSFPDDPFWWCDNPAPGADDNATGVAVALEVARALSGVSLPFDVRFVLFSGEELGLLGSGVYADSVAAAGDTIYGVLNADMVAYKLASGNPDTCHIVTNPGSKWLADWLVGTTEQYPGAFAGSSVLRIDEALAYSDHASFWRNGYDAVVAIEDAHAGDRNPVYHSLGDSLETVAPSQLALVARLLAGSIARLADPESQINLAVFPEDVTFDPDDLETGASVAFSVDVHAFGPSETVDATIQVWDGEPGEGDLLSQESVSRPAGWGEVIRHEFTWDLRADDLGEHTITVVVSAPGTDELTLADNEAAVPVRVIAPTLFVANHYAYPNPVSSLDGMAFRYELSREGRRATLRVFDLTGQEIGDGYRKVRSASAPEEDNEGVLAGWNTVPWESLRGTPPDLASGVYVYRLEVYAPGSTEPDDVGTGKFAVLR
jgi:hypothetical protein